MSFITQPLQSILIRNKRQIGTIAVDVVISESTIDNLEITQQPVQQGATISDHAFKKPTTLSMQIMFGAGPLADLPKTYKDLLDLQSTVVPFDIITPKRKYSNMLFSALGMTTDKKTENALSITCSFQEVLIVSLGTAVVPRSHQKSPQKTAAIQQTGNQSFLSSLTQGVGKLFGQ
jgi:hypothetical protein